MALRWLPLLLVLAAVLPGAGSAQILRGEVLSIGDGDTIRVRQAGKAITVRLGDLRQLHWLLWLVLALQLSTVLLVVAGPVPPAAAPLLAPVEIRP
jgi:hypothetical protein